MDILIALDSEDYLTPEAIEAELWWARALTAHGLRGSFQIVGALARRLSRERRQDVVAALAGHEIGYHSHHHSVPPHHPVLAAGLPLGQAIDRIVERERDGVAAVAELCGRHPVSYVPPGDTWTPATALAMSRLGIAVIGDSQVTRSRAEPYWFCGILHGRYGSPELCVDAYYDAPDTLAARFLAALDAQIAAHSGRRDAVLIMITHPCQLLTSTFWDGPFLGGRDPGPVATLPPAPLRDPAQVAAIKRGVEAILAGVRERRDLRVVDYQTVWNERISSCPAGRRGLDGLLAGIGAGPREADRLLRPAADTGFLDAADVDAFAYGWPIMPPGFDAAPLRAQIRALAWTAAAARRG